MEISWISSTWIKSPATQPFVLIDFLAMVNGWWLIPLFPSSHAGCLLRLLDAYDCLASADGRSEETIFGRKVRTWDLWGCGWCWNHGFLTKKGQLFGGNNLSFTQIFGYVAWYHLSWLLVLSDRCWWARVFVMTSPCWASAMWECVGCLLDRYLWRMFPMEVNPAAKDWYFTGRWAWSPLMEQWCWVLECFLYVVKGRWIRTWWSQEDTVEVEQYRKVV